jgi:hypothetical protein
VTNSFLQLQQCQRSWTSRALTRSFHSRLTNSEPHREHFSRRGLENDTMLDLPFGLALPAAERFYWFGCFSIQSCKAAFCIAVHTEQFVELRVYGLSVAMVRSLNEQRHEKCRDADYRMPAQSVCRKCEDRGKDGARPRSGARYAALVAMVLLAKRKQTAWSNVPPYLEISEPRAQMVIGSRRIGALKASSSMIATRGLSPNVTSPSARNPGNAMVGTRHP